jgi:hypothetical protein
MCLLPVDTSDPNDRFFLVHRKMDHQRWNNRHMNHYPHGGETVQRLTKRCRIFAKMIVNSLKGGHELRALSFFKFFRLDVFDPIKHIPRRVHFKVMPVPGITHFCPLVKLR